MFVEVLPNCAAPLIVQASLACPPPSSTPRRWASSAWARSRRRRGGTMLADAREFVLRAPGGSSPSPGLMILVTVLAFNLLGDGCATRSTRSSSAEG